MLHICASTSREVDVGISPAWTGPFGTRAQDLPVSLCMCPGFPHVHSEEWAPGHGAAAAPTSLDTARCCLEEALVWLLRGALCPSLPEQLGDLRQSPLLLALQS